MGYNLELLKPDGSLEHATDLCTNAGYSDLCGWIGTLAPGKYPALQALSKYGEVKPTDRLATEINEALRESPPRDPDTNHVANRLADLLGAGRPDETVRITE